MMQLTCIFRRATTELKNNVAAIFMQRSFEKVQADRKLTHDKKLRKLYQANIVTKTDRSIVTNLSNYDLTIHENQVLNKGFNYALKRKPDKIYQKTQVEKLFS